MHICFSSHYTEGMTYQDNQLPDQNSKDGHDVIVVSDSYSYQNGELVKVPEEDRLLNSGVRLIRLNFDLIINDIISNKIKKVSRLNKLLFQEEPDVVLFHGAVGWEMLTVANYKKNKPKTKFYIDSHQDFHNSGTFWLSKFFQYKIFNRFLIRKVRRYVDKFLYLSYESREFIVNMYGLNDNELEFYPLGGNIVNINNKKIYSENIRKKHNFSYDDILIVHSGKLEKAKKTKELIEAFKSIKSENLRLLIIGNIPNQEKDILEPLIASDNRILFLGWKSADELIQYLCAADLYFQPGTQSATMQNAICCGTPVALYPYKSHEPYVVGNGFFVTDVQSYINVFNIILSDNKILIEMSNRSYSIAKDLLDYKILASRLYY